LDRNRSTTVSEMRSATLSGWPSETLSEVKRKDERDKKELRRGGTAARHIKICLYVQDGLCVPADMRKGDRRAAPARDARGRVCLVIADAGGPP
jgi:hypothetical protein